MPKAAPRMTTAIDTPEGLGFVWWTERQQQLELLQHLLRYSDLSILIEGPAGSGKTEFLKRAVSQMNQELGTSAWIDAHGLTSSLNEWFEKLNESKANIISTLVIDDVDGLNKQDKYQLNCWLKAGTPRLVVTTQGASFSEVLDTRFHQLSLTPIPEDTAKQYWLSLHSAQTPRPEVLWPGDVTQPKLGVKKINKMHYKVRVTAASALSLLIVFSLAIYYGLWSYKTDTSSLLSSEDQKNSVLLTETEEPLIHRLFDESFRNKETLKSTESLPLNQTNRNRINQTANLLEEDPIKDWVLSHYTLDEESNTSSESELERQYSDSKKSFDYSSKNTKALIANTSNEKKSTFEIDSGKLIKRIQKHSAPKIHDHPLKSLPKNSYSFQLLGTRDKKNAQSFINKYSSMNQSFWLYPAMFKDKLWYVVVYGNFSSRQQAINAKKQFPSTLLKEQPWLRSMESIQKEIYTP